MKLTDSLKNEMKSQWTVTTETILKLTYKIYTFSNMRIQTVDPLEGTASNYIVALEVPSPEKSSNGSILRRWDFGNS